ncbi:MAG TPA: alpha-ketoglutarate-dependent dioxygenase AlkB [Polyangiaceae bacterium]|nr:alpha-ketoglutarate-dependent dioxygenase AlkB [Polyangiaceae bacterium]
MPSWTQGADQAFQLLFQACSWEQHERNMYDRVVAVPRLLAARPGRSTGVTFADSQRIGLATSRAPAGDIARANGLLEDWSTRLGSRYGRRLEHVALAHYRDGADGVAFHGDRLGSLRPDTIVAIVSLGAPRRFLLRPSPRQPELAGMAGKTFELREGDLLVMGGSCQETWEHSIPKMRRAGPRLAVMFRERWEEEEVRPIASAGSGSLASERPLRRIAGR